MSIVIVEGPDGSGKTSLIRRLRQDSKNYFWIASSSGRPKSLVQLQDALHWIAQSTYLGTPIVCDRFPLISESVYGPVLRDSCLLDQMGHRDRVAASDLLRQIDRIVYCRPPISTIRQNITTGALPQLQGVVENLDALVACYDELMDTLRDDNIFVYAYDYTKNGSPPDEICFGRP